jgi:hypothetical protein
MELKHPPEYEIKPSDLDAVSGASLVVYGGYEKFAKRLAETSGGAGVYEMKIFTDNVPAVLKAEAKRSPTRSAPPTPTSDGRPPSTPSPRRCRAGG